MEREKLYARIHPDARQDNTVIRRCDTAGLVFERGVGPYNGWHPVSEEQAAKLRRKYISPNNPNTMRMFQIEVQAQVDVIAGSEARSRMTPEAKRIDHTREQELAHVKAQLGEVQRVLAVLGNPELLARLARLSELDQAASGSGMSQEAGDRIEKVVAAPPRRPNLDERILDDASDRRAPTGAAAPPNSATSNKPAPPPAARPGAQPGKPDGKKQDGGKKHDKDAPPAARPGTAQAAPPPASLASPSDIIDPSLLDDDEDT